MMAMAEPACFPATFRVERFEDGYADLTIRLGPVFILRMDGGPTGGAQLHFWGDGKGASGGEFEIDLGLGPHFAGQLADIAKGAASFYVERDGKGNSTLMVQFANNRRLSLESYADAGSTVTFHRDARSLPFDLFDLDGGTDERLAAWLECLDCKVQASTP
jgi:hypothetical protein